MRPIIMFLFLLVGCGGAVAPTPADECTDAGNVLYDVHEGERVRVPHPPGSGHTYGADGASVAIVGPIVWYATLEFTNVTADAVLLVVRVGDDVLCANVEREP